ncbi:MAG: maleylpyruvate isomerase [Propionibacteriaceae bacterium]|jgi:maleylpyruvate isomerase|nr:hypothetical protein [Propionibacteriaceae bacterium]MDX6322342.1 maleylpyruvate isomerase [Propionibacteriaceae bacterium]
MNSSEPNPTDAAQPATSDPRTDQLEAVRELVTHATQQLLGDTITVSDEDWRAASRLPGWSRAHVASHLARQADALGRLVEGARLGERREMYPDPGQRDAEIEDGAGRLGLELQIDLDTSAGRLSAGFDQLDQADGWDAVVELRGGIQVPARLLPLARLTEVVLHHVDLDIGFTVDDIDEQTSEWLLEWSAFRLRNRDEFPTLLLTSTSGFTITVGSAGPPLPVQGTSAQLLGWLTSRAGDQQLSGAQGLVLPSF